MGHWIVLYFHFRKCDFFYHLSNNINYYNNLIYKFMSNNCSYKFTYSTVKIQASARCNTERFKDILAYFETENISQNELIVQNFYNWLVKCNNPFMYYEENYI